MAFTTRIKWEEFATARQHLLANLPGCIAWKDPAQAEAQKERMRQKREKELAERIQRQETIHPIEELESAGEAQESPAFVYECDRRKQIERKTKTLYCLWEQSESGADGISLSDCEGSRKE